MHIRTFSLPFTFTITTTSLRSPSPYFSDSYTSKHQNQDTISSVNLLVRVAEMITATKVAPLFQRRSHQCFGYSPEAPRRPDPYSFHAYQP
jgi:hypothetical protein